MARRHTSESATGVFSKLDGLGQLDSNGKNKNNPFSREYKFLLAVLLFVYYVHYRYNWKSAKSGFNGNILCQLRILYQCCTSKHFGCPYINLSMRLIAFRVLSITAVDNIKGDRGVLP